MKRKHNGGFSLIEVLVAMAVLGIVTIPTTSALLTAHRMNVKAEQMLEAQLDVSSAVEELMADGANQVYTEYEDEANYPGVKITTEELSGKPYCYKVVVTSKKDESVSVTTYIRKIAQPAQNPAGGAE